MTLLKIPDLPNVEWKSCTKCGGTKKSMLSLKGNPCVKCSGTGLEPVAVENEIVKKECGFHYKDHYHDYKLQVGVPFEIDGEVFWEEDGFKHKARVTEKFLPLRPKTEGDNSVLMVVKV